MRWAPDASNDFAYARFHQTLQPPFSSQQRLVDAGQHYCDWSSGDPYADDDLAAAQRGCRDDRRSQRLAGICPITFHARNGHSLLSLSGQAANLGFGGQSGPSVALVVG